MILKSTRVTGRVQVPEPDRWQDIYREQCLLLRELTVKKLCNSRPNPPRPFRAMGPKGLFSELRQQAVIHDHPPTCDSGANAGKAKAEQQVPEKSLGIQGGERNVIGDHDIGQLPRCQRSPSLFEQAVGKRAVIFQQYLAGLGERYAWIPL